MDTMKWFSDAMAWVPWLLGGGGLAAGLAVRFLGLAPVLAALGKAVEVALAVAQPLLVAAAEGAVWLWQNVFWRGIKDIIDDWATLATVGAMGFFLWTSLEGKAKLQQHDLNKEIASVKKASAQCTAEMKKLRGVAGKLVPKAQSAPSSGFKFFWE
jgi:hypothetical protein